MPGSFRSRLAKATTGALGFFVVSVAIGVVSLAGLGTLKLATWVWNHTIGWVWDHTIGWVFAQTVGRLFGPPVWHVLQWVLGGALLLYVILQIAT